MPGNDEGNDRTPEASPRRRAALSWWAVSIGLVALLTGLVVLAGDPSGATWWFVVGTYVSSAVLLAFARRRLVTRPELAVAVSAAYLIAASVAVMVATRQHVLWQSLLGLFVSVAVGAVALMVLVELAKRRRPIDTSRARGIKLGVIAAVGVGMAVWGLLAGNRLLSFEGLVVAGVGLAAVSAWVGEVGVAAPERFLAGSVLAVVQSVVLLQAAHGADLAMGVGLVLWVAGVTVFKLALGSWVRCIRVAGARPVGDTRRARIVTAASGVGVVVGVALIVFGARWSELTAVLGGVTLAVMALSAFGIGVVWTDMPRWLSALMAVGGFVLVVVGYVAMRDALRVWGIALLVSVVVMAVGAWFVFRGEGLVAMLLAGLILLWGLGDRATTVEADPNPSAGTRILAIGDSYISGEGAPEYFSGTNSVGDQRNECRRAPTAHPYLIASRLGMGLDFFACSGATTLDVLSEAQMPDSPADVVGGLPQLGNLAAFSPSQVEAIDVVLVSIGGNDVGFSTIVKACLLPRDCNELREGWIANVQQLRPQLVTTYTAIKEAVPDTPVIVVPYPNVAGDTACGLGLQAAEHEFVVEFIDELDGQIAAAAQEAGVRYFAEGKDVFADHLLCSASPATRHLDLSPPEGDWLARYSPGRWVHGSMHPNELGHELIAARLRVEVEAALEEARQAELEREVLAEQAREAAEEAASELVGSDVIEGTPEVEAAIVDAVGDVAAADVVATGEAIESEVNPEPVEPVSVDEPTAEQVEQAAEAQQLLTDKQWINDELYRTVRALLLPTLALMVGSMFAAAGLVMSRRRIVNFLSPLVPVPAVLDEGGGGGRGLVDDRV